VGGGGGVALENKRKGAKKNSKKGSRVTQKKVFSGNHMANGKWKQQGGKGGC